MKSDSYKIFLKFSSFLILLITLINSNPIKLQAEEIFSNNVQLDSSTKSEENNIDIISNPFQVVEMLRKANSMNDATKPSDAIDDALNSFNSLENK